ncbi:MAG: manganese efflux pump [Clostridia bacterium]|nr:manganese efflux pump [Clostridia bacterium]
MNWSFLFFANAILFGIGLAMDAFSVSLANGLNEPHMRKRKRLEIAGMFGLFQAAMPMIGWLCVHTVVNFFSAFQKVTPWIALVLLGFIGGKMIKDGVGGEAPEEYQGLGFGLLVVQSVATSIDALSVGFSIANYHVSMALAESLIIGIVTFGICIAGLLIGRKAGTKLSGKAQILGGCILILLGLEICITGVLGK